MTEPKVANPPGAEASGSAGLQISWNFPKSFTTWLRNSATLSHMKSQECRGERGSDAERAPSDTTPQLPAWKAFVVQFSRDTGTGSGVWAGRVEHLSSGRRARFNTPQELLTILSMLLDELC